MEIQTLKGDKELWFGDGGDNACAFSLMGNHEETRQYLARSQSGSIFATIGRVIQHDVATEAKNVGFPIGRGLEYAIIGRLGLTRQNSSL